MKRVITKKRLDIVDVSEVDMQKIYAGRHRVQESEFVIITRESFCKGDFKPISLSDNFTNCNGWNRDITLQKCIERNHNFEWYEFDTFEEVCEWYLKEISK